MPLRKFEPFDLIAAVLATGYVVIGLSGYYLPGERIAENEIEIFADITGGIEAILIIYMTDRLVNRRNEK